MRSPSPALRSPRSRRNAVAIDESHNSIYNPDFLRRRTRWIRDELDPQVARHGHDALHADDILKLDKFLRQLLTAKISLEDIRSSRVHLAISEISGLGTRWSKRLIERSDALKEVWEAMYGPLRAIGFPLYGPGGRLHNVAKPENLSKEELIMKWLRVSGADRLSQVKALRSGGLGFKPGDWWINTLFAFREGIINGVEAPGGIIADLIGGYALVMTGTSEESSSSPDEFVYRAQNTDRGRYRLTCATPDSRHPIRVLRSHTLRSFWAPRAGLRYDGLHKIAGWTIRPDPKTREMMYLISFKRLPDQPSMDEVLRRPWTEEVEDYREYKRLRQLARQKAGESAGPTVAVSTDGIMDVYGAGTTTSLRELLDEATDPEPATMRRHGVIGHGAVVGSAGIPVTAHTLQNADAAAGTRSDSAAE
ncbi:hypothetical protein LTR53_011651 [Teratosphaeriaceae sp. CCFEE 6253]|nr:hypothetical protein LTR53_011651 [Teratosphaeriaceae sp. CCFEE 6253]